MRFYMSTLLHLTVLQIFIDISFPGKTLLGATVQMIRITLLRQILDGQKFQEGTSNSSFEAPIKSKHFIT